MREMRMPRRPTSAVLSPRTGAILLGALSAAAGSALLVERSVHWYAAASRESVPSSAATFSVGPSGTARKEEEPAGAAVLNLASETVWVPVPRTMRWLWWPLILYLFWGMGYVCDMYFVRTIEVISERFEIPDDVAGATLMALGCNGPEMALNTIAIFHPSNIGVGAVIGGEVFNVLVIIGAAMLATPREFLPLQIGLFSFSRDVLFYIGSVALLYWVLSDRLVSRTDSLLLLAGAVAYSSTVMYSDKLRLWFSESGLRRSWSRNSFGEIGLDEALAEKQSRSDAPDPDVWDRARRSTSTGVGSVLGVRVDLRNRLMDRSSHFEERYMRLTENYLMVSTVVGPNIHSQGHAESGIMYDQSKHTQHHHQHHGGLVNLPVYRDNIDEDQGSRGSPQPRRSSSSQVGEDSVKKRRSSSVVRQNSNSFDESDFCSTLDLDDAPWELIPLQDVLYCEEAPKTITGTHQSASRPPGRRLSGEKGGRDHCRVKSVGDDPAPTLSDPTSGGRHGAFSHKRALSSGTWAPHDFAAFTLHVHQHNEYHGSLGNLITLEFSGREEEVVSNWVAGIQKKLREQKRASTAAPPEDTLVDLMWNIVDWLQQPVKGALRLTIPDMDKTEKQWLYPLSFMMSMAWLAIFAFSVVGACDGIHDEFGISTQVLGFTVAAAGTSFPNVFSGMVVARQGKTTMAIANALGANVQNVFLALAIPWTIRSCFIEHGPFALTVRDLTPAVLECGITLLPVLIVFVCYSGSMPRWSGGLYLLTYLVYLVFALKQEESNCPSWPFHCSN